jgi:hypothetical protein
MSIVILEQERMVSKSSALSVENGQQFTTLGWSALTCIHCGEDVNKENFIVEAN